MNTTCVGTSVLVRDTHAGESFPGELATPASPMLAHEIARGKSPANYVYVRDLETGRCYWVLRSDVRVTRPVKLATH